MPPAKRPDTPGLAGESLLAHDQRLLLVVWSEKLVYFGENRQDVRTIEQILFEYSRAEVGFSVIMYRMPKNCSTVRGFSLSP